MAPYRQVVVIGSCNVDISYRVRAAPEAYANDALRRKLLNAALDFTRSLPKK